MSDALGRLLATTYGGCNIDNPADRATDNRGKLFHWYCAVSVRVDGVNRFWLQLRGGVPARESFVKLTQTKQSEIVPGEVSILLTVEDIDYLRALAMAIDGDTPMPRPGREPWHYQAHLTAAALRRLADLLQARLPELLRHGVPGPERQQQLF